MFSTGRGEQEQSKRVRRRRGIRVLLIFTAQKMTSRATKHPKLWLKYHRCYL
jgi:hypothetical protein